MSHLNRHPIVSEDLQRITEAALPWQDLEESTVVITGAAGLVASYLVEALLFRNEQHSGHAIRVVATVRNTAAAKERFAAYLGRRDFEILHHDATEPLRYERRIQYLVHAAGNATPSAFGRDPIGTYAPNVLGTHHLMARAKADETRGVLFLSSGAVHGALDPEAPPLSESIYGSVDPLDPRASYAESKRMGETICRSWWVQHGVPVRMARLGHSYGPGMRRSDERAFAQFVFCALDGRDIVLNSDGSAVRPYCYLADATVALLLILLSGGNGEAYLVANTEAMCSIRELAELVASLAPHQVTVRRAESAPPVEYLPNRDPFHRLDTSKIISLGWRPQTHLRDGFRRTLDSYR